MQKLKANQLNRLSFLGIKQKLSSEQRQNLGILGTLLKS